LNKIEQFDAATLGVERGRFWVIWISAVSRFGLAASSIGLIKPVDPIHKLEHGHSGTPPLGGEPESIILARW